MAPALDTVVLAREAWLRACAESPKAAGLSATAAMKGLGDAISALNDNLGVIGYPFEIATQKNPMLDEALSRMERSIGSTIPPVLKVFWREIGGISLVDLEAYDHVGFWAKQGVRPPKGFSDGLHVDACTDDWANFVCGDYKDWVEDGQPQEEFLLSLSPDGYHKDNISGGEAYGMLFSDSWTPRWENFVWSGEQPNTAPVGTPLDFLSYLRTTILECAGFPGLFGLPEYEPIKKRLLEGVPVF